MARIKKKQPASRQVNLYLKGHLKVLERSLLCRSKLANSSGHTIHKGALRENFVREFVIGHTGEDLGVSSGEIFDARRVVGDRANQIDVIIYEKNWPKIKIVSDDINAFLVESVHAAIEVKSVLNESALSSAYAVAHALKSLKRDTRYPIKCFLLTYSARAKMQTIVRWLIRASKTNGNDTIPNALDGVFVLGKGSILSPNIALFMKERTTNVVEPLAATGEWIYAEQQSGNLYILFFALNYYRYGINIGQYFKGVLTSYKVATTRSSNSRK